LGVKPLSTEAPSEDKGGTGDAIMIAGVWLDTWRVKHPPNLGATTPSALLSFSIKFSSRRMQR